MTYIPLDEDTKVKGKAATDVVCNPLGKSGGALIQQVLILGCGPLANSTPYLGGILLVIVVAWLYAARSLDRQFTPLVKKDLKTKLLEGKLSANLKKKPEVTYRFVSVLSDQGFIEGRYVPVTESNIPSAQSDGNFVMPASPSTHKRESTTSTTGVAGVVRPTDSSDGGELHSSEPTREN